MRKLILFGIIALMLAACSKDSVDQSLVDDDVIQNYLAQNSLDASKHESGLYYIIEEEGEGATPDLSSIVGIRYKGWLTNGTLFGSVEEDDILIHTVSQLIPGWKVALSLLKPGGKGKFIIPSDLGFGSQGIPGTIPPNAVLDFDIELDSIFENQASADDYAIQKYLERNELQATAHESGIYYVITEEGTGEHPDQNSDVEVIYKGMFTSGQVFDETPEGETSEISSFVELIEGFRIAIPLLKTGGKGIFLIPSALAYGEAGADLILPNTVLVFEIELVSFE